MSDSGRLMNEEEWCEHQREADQCLACARKRVRELEARVKELEQSVISTASSFATEIADAVMVEENIREYLGVAHDDMTPTLDILKARDKMLHDVLSEMQGNNQRLREFLEGMH